jgi:hypothetical protein
MRGGSKAHLIEGDDGNCYIVKFANNPQHPRVLVNEWVAAQLMRHIGIRTPPTELVDASQEFLALNTPDVHFGSRYPGHPPDTTAIHDVLPDAFLPRITSCSDFIGALVFDRRVSNADGPQAIFVPLIQPHKGPHAGRRDLRR